MRDLQNNAQSGSVGGRAGEQARGLFTRKMQQPGPTQQHSKAGEQHNDRERRIPDAARAQIAEIELKGNLELNIAGENIKIWREDVEILNHEIEGWVVESEEGVTVAIDTELSEKLIAEGYATKQIAGLLSLSIKTVEKHRANLMRKLNLRNVAMLTAYAIKNEIVAG